MNTVDWKLIIGYDLQEARELLAEEAVDFSVVHGDGDVGHLDEQLRVIGVRYPDHKPQLVCAVENWSVGKKTNTGVDNG